MLPSTPIISDIISASVIVGVLWGISFCFVYSIPNKHLLLLEEENNELRRMLEEQEARNFANTFTNVKND